MTINLFRNWELWNLKGSIFGPFRDSFIIWKQNFWPWYSIEHWMTDHSLTLNLLWGNLRLVLFLFNSITLLHLAIRNLKMQIPKFNKNWIEISKFNRKIPVIFPVNFTILTGTGIPKNRPILAGTGILPGSRSILAYEVR